LSEASSELPHRTCAVAEHQRDLVDGEHLDVVDPALSLLRQRRDHGGRLGQRVGRVSGAVLIRGRSGRRLGVVVEDDAVGVHPAEPVPPIVDHRDA
jgi:hypothetical protein